MRSRVKITGMKELQRSLENIQRKIKENIDGEVSFNDLFNEKFMATYTNFKDIDDFFSKSPFEINTQEDLDNLNVEELDQFVSENTKFDSWEEMKQKAGSEYVQRKMKDIL